MSTTKERSDTEAIAALTSGSDTWHSTAAQAGDGPRRLLFSDGPHGLRRQRASGDALGIGDSEPATCFPPAVALGSSWNPELLRRVGAALGAEARALGVDVLLGPGMNIKRSPLGGRNFEYLSEDPHLTGRLAAALVDGTQSAGVAACVKHFAVNNQETDRMRVSALVGQRALREIYLSAFEHVVRTARPWVVMSAYNRINGVPASENRWLLTELLRGTWGFDGLTVSDWGAVDDRVAALRAGLDLEMPPSGTDGQVAAAVREGALPRAAVEAVARRLSQLAARVDAARAVLPAATPAELHQAHHALAREAAAESAVLLRNEGDLLPLIPGQHRSIAVIGEFAERPRHQGGGSSRVVPTRLPSALDALRRRYGADTITYAPGFRLPAPRPPQRAEPPADTASPGAAAAGRVLPSPTAVDDARAATAAARPQGIRATSAAAAEVPPAAAGGATPTPTGGRTAQPHTAGAALAAEAAALAARSDVALLFLGLPVEAESEGFDRGTIDLPADQLALLRAVSAVCRNVVVMLANGGVLAVADWQRHTAAILECWLPGQAGGEAVVDLLSGDRNPSGRLAETIPLRLADHPSFPHFPGGGGETVHGEDVFVGYRGFDARGLPVAHPFGHGLSYTRFGYSDLAVEPHGENRWTVRFTVTNTGDRAGAEVAQLYLAWPPSDDGPPRPPVELRGFAKPQLAPGESRSLALPLGPRELRVWDTRHDRWSIGPGRYRVLVGASSRDIRLRGELHCPGDGHRPPLTAGSTIGEWRADPHGRAVLAAALAGAPGADSSRRKAALAAAPELLPMIESMPLAKLCGFGLGITDAAIDALVARAARLREQTTVETEK